MLLLLQVVTNVTLAVATASADGSLLQPSVPLFPVAELLTEQPPLGPRSGHVWTTYTAVEVHGADSYGGNDAAAVAVWFTALGFSAISAVEKESGSVLGGEHVPPPPMPSDCFVENATGPVSYKFAPGSLFPHEPNHGVKLTDSPAHCCAMCQSFKNCSYWTYEHAGSAAKPTCYSQAGGCCFLKTAAAFTGRAKGQAGCTSGSTKPPAPPATFSLTTANLAASVGGFTGKEAPTVRFSDVPTASFPGLGDTTLGGRQYVSWPSDALVAPTAREEWRSTLLVGTVSMAVDSAVPDLVNFAPVLGGVAFLGEAHKISAVSVHRFSAVSVKAGAGSGLSLGMRGKPGEVVTLLYSAAGGGAIKERNVTIGADGTGVADITPTML